MPNFVLIPLKLFPPVLVNFDQLVKIERYFDTYIFTFEGGSQVHTSFDVTKQILEEHTSYTLDLSTNEIVPKPEPKKQSKVGYIDPSIRSELGISVQDPREYLEPKVNSQPTPSIEDFIDYIDNHPINKLIKHRCDLCGLTDVQKCEFCQSIKPNTQPSPQETSPCNGNGKAPSTEESPNHS